MNRTATTTALLLPAFGGIAALSWEVIWQLRTSLSFGVSASGAAITLATMMVGMTWGARACAKWLEKRGATRPLQLYGLLEIAIGVCGIFLGSLFGLLASMDRWVYSVQPELAPMAHLLGVVIVIFAPAACMGASIPIFGEISRRTGIATSTLYGINTIGAAAGTLLVAFCFIPTLGLSGTAYVAALINLVVGLVAWFVPLPDNNLSMTAREDSVSSSDLRERVAPGVLALVFMSGFVVFLLEVAWFRALRAAFETTTSGFAVMLAVVLLTLGVSARYVQSLKRRGYGLEFYLGIAAIAIFLGTPLIERMDLTLLNLGSHNTPIHWFVLTTALVGPAVFLLGLILPWNLEDDYSPKALGRIYAVNTLGAAFGAVSAAWVFLPSIGFVHTAWVAGGIVFASALVMYGKRVPVWMPAAGVAAFLLAAFMDSGVGRTRVLFSFPYGEHTVLAHHEGPDAATSAIEMKDGGRGVFIDGFAAAAFWPTSHYMSWMGSLPALLHDGPKDALVICFGTGQTANAVRNEGLENTVIVDINPAVFQIAKLFPDNERVLEDPKVHPVLMDGRAFLRRTDQMFDVITLEPMPPNHAGVNALYSREFYELARKRLRPGGVIAQWLPAHLVSTQHARSVAATFQDVFPNSAMWTDPEDINGILLGSMDDDGRIGTAWPGLDRDKTRETVPKRSLGAEAIRAALLLDRDDLKRYVRRAPVVTDDNQLLAYGSRLSLKESGPRKMNEVEREFRLQD